MKYSLFQVYWRGLAMGAADIVPGVSGGTIALITGIYDRFINSLTSIGHFETLRDLKCLNIKRFIARTDLFFLMTLFAGILTSVIGLASLITYLLVNYPHPLWAFFLGLILASSWVLFQDLKAQGPVTHLTYVFLIFGIALALILGRMTPQDFQVQHWHYFAGGAVAICAMILPGVSGSFLLLMLGLYGPVLAALKNFDVINLALFCGGCGIGLLSFSHLLSWCLRRYPQLSYGFLIGLMLGAIEKIWPWKIIISTRINSKGELVPFIQEAVMPWVFQQDTGTSANIAVSLFSFGLGLLCILFAGRLMKVDKI